MMIRSLPAQQHINWQRVPIITMLAAFSAAGINSLVYGIAVLVHVFPALYSSLQQGVRCPWRRW